MVQIKARTHHLWHVVLKRIWWLLFVVVFSGLSAAIGWRDELLPPEIARKWRILNLIPHWNWGWWVLLSASAILAVLIEGSYRTWRSEHEARVSAEKAATGPRTDDGPNWAIQEVFSYLEPEALNRPQDNLWQKAGDKIRDALSLGQIRSWGRPYKTKLGDWVGERAALRPICKKYWEKAYFTYFFFDPTAQDQTHCYADRDTGRPAYTDLQVNRAEVLKVWPGEPTDVAEIYANVRVADNPALIDFFTVCSIQQNKLLALLQEGKLRSWAKHSIPDHDHNLHKLDPSIWHQKKLTFCRAVSKRHINQTFLGREKIYPWTTTTNTNYDVWLNFAELKRVWPDLQITMATKR